MQVSKTAQWVCVCLLAIELRKLSTLYLCEGSTECKMAWAESGLGEECECFAFCTVPGKGSSLKWPGVGSAVPQGLSMHVWAVPGEPCGPSPAQPLLLCPADLSPAGPDGHHHQQHARRAAGTEWPQPAGQPATPGAGHGEFWAHRNEPWASGLFTEHCSHCPQIWSGTAFLLRWGENVVLSLRNSWTVAHLTGPPGHWLENQSPETRCSRLPCIILPGMLLFCGHMYS